VVGIGEQSEIRARELASRAAESKAPVRVLYLSDFDPGGRSMPKALARKVEFAINKHDLDVDFQLIPLALTPEQCRQYNLPRTPIKEKESRKDTFEQTFRGRRDRVGRAGSNSSRRDEAHCRGGDQQLARPQS
jgi:hypothetical protein